MGVHRSFLRSSLPKGCWSLVSATETNLLLLSDILSPRRSRSQYRLRPTNGKKVLQILRMNYADRTSPKNQVSVSENEGSYQKTRVRIRKLGFVSGHRFSDAECRYFQSPLQGLAFPLSSSGQPLGAASTRVAPCKNFTFGLTVFPVPRFHRSPVRSIP